MIIITFEKNGINVLQKFIVYDSIKLFSHNYI